MRRRELRRQARLEQLRAERAVQAVEHLLQQERRQLGGRPRRGREPAARPLGAERERDAERPPLGRLQHRVRLGVGHVVAAAEPQQRVALVGAEREVGGDDHRQAPARAQLRRAQRQRPSRGDGHAQRRALGRDQRADDGGGLGVVGDVLGIVEDERERVGQQALELADELAQRRVRADATERSGEPVAEHVGGAGDGHPYRVDHMVQQPARVAVGDRAAQSGQRRAGR